MTDASEGIPDVVAWAGGNLAVGYLEALRAGVDRPVVVAMDLRDPAAQSIARDTIQRIADPRAEVERLQGGDPGVLPVYQFTLPWTEAVRLVDLYAPGAFGGLGLIPEGHFLVVAVADGRISLVAVRSPARARPGGIRPSAN